MEPLHHRSFDVFFQPESEVVTTFLKGTTHEKHIATGPGCM
jgi:hypothetical protein